MVDKSGNTAAFCGINDRIFVNSKKITASYPALQISSLSHIGYLLPNFLADVFNNHIVGGDVLLGVQSPVMNSRAGESNGLFTLFELVEA